jgi:pyrimidine-nucleoside phosphorylase
MDIKTGNGAFLEKFTDAKKLAITMMAIGKLMKKKISVFITDMNQPLGKAVGNSLEVIEAIEFLKGNQERDLKEIVFTFAQEFLLRTKIAANKKTAEDLITKIINEGKALKKFQELIKNQGGDERVIDDYNLLPQAKYQELYRAPKEGYLFSFHTKKIGWLVNFLNGGRKQLGEQIDYSVGFIFYKKIGDYVKKGEPLLAIHANDEKKLKVTKSQLKEVIVIKNKKPKIPSLIYWYGRA